MRRQWLVGGLFWAGVFLLFVHTTLPALWEVSGLPGAYPLASSDGILAVSAGFTPPLGTALMVAAGLVGGSRPKRED